MNGKKEGLIISWRKVLDANYAHLVRQFSQFSFIGATGVVVNFAVLVIERLISSSLFHLSENKVIVKVPFTVFNVRVYHVMIVIAFLVANLWNYSVNRKWAFKSSNVSWTRGAPKFIVAGIAGLIVSLLVATALMNPTSPFYLSGSVFDNGNPIFIRLYWANAVGIIFGTPVNFLINKLWTFRHKSEATLSSS